MRSANCYIRTHAWNFDRLRRILPCSFLALAVTVACAQQPPSTPIVLHAARLSQVDTGTLLQPGEVLIDGERIRAVGKWVEHPQGARVIDLGDTTLSQASSTRIPFFLHPGAEDLQTVVESVPWRTILAEQAAKADVMAGFTAERDMGTEGAGSADTAIRDAINQGLIPGPRLRISGNAIDILGGHEDANRYNPAQHVLSNADYANSAEQLVEVMREQHKQGSDFTKIYETGRDQFDRRHSAHALPIHRRAAHLCSRGGATPRRIRCRSRDGRTRHALRRASRGGIHRPRNAAQRRNYPHHA